MGQIRRQQFLISAGALLAALVVPPAWGQPRVGLLWLESNATPEVLTAFREGLRENGYVEGQNIVFQHRHDVAGYDRLEEAAADLAGRKVDVIVSWGDTATRAARKVTSNIPIVMIVAFDPVQAGLVASLARPGGNITGITSSGQELVAKRLELLKEVVPRIERVAVLFNPASQGEVRSLRHAEIAARSLGLGLVASEVRTPQDIEKAITEAVRARAGGVSVVPGTMLRANRARIAELLLDHRLPATFPDSTYADAGGLLSYGRDSRFPYRRAANYVARILKGAKPAEMPIEQPTKLELVVNLRAAAAMGLTIPQSVLLRADRVVE